MTAPLTRAMEPTTRYAHKLVCLCNASLEVLHLLRQVLEQSEIRTVIFYMAEIYADSKDFVQFVKAHNPDLVIFDVPIPYEDNWRRFDQLREDHALDDVSFLVTSTSPETVKGMAKKDKRDVVDVVVGKPFDLDDLLNAVQEFLD